MSQSTQDFFNSDNIDNTQENNISYNINIDDNEEFNVVDDNENSQDFIDNYNIFYNYFHNEISNIVENRDKFGISLIKSSTMNLYITQLKKNINKYDDNLNDLIILYYTTRSFYKYNMDYLNFSYREFREKIYYPNIIYISIKFLFNSHKFINNLIGNVYYDYKCKYPSIIQKFSSSYYYDTDLIKSTIFYTLIGSQIPKFNPLNINKLKTFYKEVIRNIFYYFFKKRDDLNTIYTSGFASESNSSFESIYSGLVTNRLNIYKDILYNIYIDKKCRQNSIQYQLAYNFNIFRKIIIPNELQEIFYSIVLEDNPSNSEQFKILDLYDKNNEFILLKIKKLPIIYKLLKSVHILNPRTLPHNTFVINRETVKNEIYLELFTIFKDLFCDEHIKFLLNNIANNFVNNILSGEYINLLTLETIRIDQISFISQLKKFVRLCIKNEL